MFVFCFFFRPRNKVVNQIKKKYKQELKKKRFCFFSPSKKKKIKDGYSFRNCDNSSRSRQ